MHLITRPVVEGLVHDCRRFSGVNLSLLLIGRHALLLLRHPLTSLLNKIRRRTSTRTIGITTATTYLLLRLDVASLIGVVVGVVHH